MSGPVNYDWRELVLQRVRLTKLSAGQRDQIISELAAHLEDVYRDGRARGMSHDAALQFALQEIEDRRVLAADIHRALEANFMNTRTKTIWLPALASFALASLFLLGLTRTGFEQSNLVRLASLAPWFYGMWLASQIFSGALGAGLSRRAGGTLTARIVAATFPAMVLFCLWAVVIPVSAFAQHNQFVLRHPLSYALGIFVWVVPPGFALLLGAAPFLRNGEHQTQP